MSFSLAQLSAVSSYAPSVNANKILAVTSGGGGRGVIFSKLLHARYLVMDKNPMEAGGGGAITTPGHFMHVWVTCDRLVIHPGGEVPIHFILGILCCNINPSREVVILLVTLCWAYCVGPASHPGRVVTLLFTSCWGSCDVISTHPGK